MADKRKEIVGGLGRAAKRLFAERPDESPLSAIRESGRAKLMLHGGDNALPLVLPRARLSPDFIDQQADRVARQMLGEHVVSGKPKDTTNLAGRSLKESQRVKGLNYKLSPIGTVAKETPYTPRKGDVKVAFPGDQTVANKMLDEIEGVPIDSVQEGGAYYGLGQKHLPDPEFWKSNEAPAKMVQGKVDRVAELYEPERVIGSHLAMGPTSNNFAMHFADANLRAIDWSKANPKKINVFDNIIAGGYKDPKTGDMVTFPDWPGLADREAALAAMKENTALRKWFNNRMKTPKLTEPLGLPNGLDIQYAITEPRIRDMEINMTGLMTGELKPGALVEAAGNPHNTYTHRILGEAGGPQEVLTPFVLDFPDAAQHIASTKRPSDFTGTIQKVFPHQVVDDQYINQYNQYRERIKKLTGQKKGGAVDIEAADARLEDAIASRMARGGKVDIEAADARLGQAIAQRMAGNVPRETSEGVQHMGSGGKADAAKGLKNVFTRVFQETPPPTPKVRPPSDNVANVRQANFSYPKVIGNQTVKIDKLSGGVRMSDPNEVKRVKALADKIASPEGYISRIIVDHNDNVIEGQHRLEALRQLGVKDVPVYKIEDLAETMPVLKMEEAMRGAGGIHSDHVNQLMQHLLEDIAENGIGGAGKLDYGKWQKHYDAALEAASKTEAPAYNEITGMVSKMGEEGRSPIVPVPNRWFLRPDKFPNQQKLIERVLQKTGKSREDFPSGAFIDPRTGEVLDSRIMDDLGVVIDPKTNRPMMSAKGESGIEQLDPKTGAFTKSNLVRKGLFKPEGGDPLLNDLSFLATIEKGDVGHKYGLATEYASPAELWNTGTGANPTLRPRSRGDLFGIGDIVGQARVGRSEPHDVYEKLFVAPKGSDVQGVKLSKANGGAMAEGGPAFKKLQFMGGGGGAKSKNAPKFTEAFTQGLGPMLYGAARGTAAGLAGIGGDIEELARLGINYAGDKLQGRFPNMLDKKDVVGAKATLPTSERVLSKIPSLKDFGAGPEARHSEDIAAKLGMYGLSNIAAPKVGKAVVQGVNATGKALAPKAGEMLENYMVRTGGILPMDVWHGSPHRFPPTAKNPLGEFDASKIGTGEGAQAYGHGHYSAEVRDLAKTYQPRSPLHEEKLIKEYNRAQVKSNYPKMEVLEDAMLHKSPDEILAKFSNIEDGYTPEHAKAANEYLLWLGKNQPEVGSLYKVDLPDAQIAKMLDWDKPLSEQAPNVQAAINKQASIDAAKYGEGGGMDYYRGDPHSYSGESIYHYLTEQNGGAIPTSEMLREMGIPGIKYLDQGSRDAGEGTRNFVVFPGNEEMLNILSREKDGGVVHMGGGGRSDAAKGLGKGFKRLFADPAESFVASGRKGVEDGRGGNTIIKEGGGNWMAGDVERGLKGLKGKELSPEDLALARYRTTEYKGGNPDITAGQIRRLNQYEMDAQLNKLIDKQLTKYVKNQMGTKDDPIRLAADAFPAQKAKLLAEKQVQIDKATADMEKARQLRGYTPEMMTESQKIIRKLEKEQELIEHREGLHFKPFEVHMPPTHLPEMRRKAGMPPENLGQTENAKNWENLADRNIESSTARSWTEGSLYPEPLQSNPWLHKVDPESKVYVGRDLERGLGFDHMMDELRNATTPTSGLPKELLIDPKLLSKWTIPQAAEHVDKINAWRASQTAEANRVIANNAATFLHKDYPDKGMKWVELKMPDKAPEGWVDDVTKGGKADLDPNYAYGQKTLADALKYEGEQLQTCVAGYCRDVIDKKSQIFSLRDEKGKSHATVEVKPNQHLDYNNWFARQPEEIQNKIAQRRVKDKNYDVYETPEYLADFAAQPPSIAQIKGKGNRAPSEEYLPYVQDFVRSGKWSDVQDLHHTGLVRKSDYIDEFTPNQLDSIGSGEYVTKQELDSLRLPPEGMAEGGVIHMDKGGTLEEQEAKRYGIPETPEQELQRYLRMFRINASGGKDKYGADMGGRLGINIPLSQNVSIEPYFQGSAYKPNSGKVERGGIAGANLNIRFNNGGSVSDGAFKKIQWQSPQHFKNGNVVSFQDADGNVVPFQEEMEDAESPATVNPMMARQRDRLLGKPMTKGTDKRWEDVKENAKEIYKETKAELGSDLKRLENSPAARAQLFKIWAAGNAGGGPDFLNFINEYVLDPIKSVTADKVFTKPSSVMLPNKNREDIGYNRDGTRVPKLRSIADVFTTESGVPNPQKGAVISSYPYDNDEPNIDAKLKRIPLGGSEQMIERMQARDLMYGGKQTITDPHTGQQTEINTGRFHPIIEIGGSILTGGGLNAATKAARKGYQILTNPARIRASALSRAIDKDVETFTKKPLPRKRGGLAQLNAR